MNTTTPEPTDPAEVSEMAEQVPVCRSCGEPSPNGDPCETCVECERILAMSDEEVVAEAGPEGMAWARGFKEGLRAGLSGRHRIEHSTPDRNAVLEESARDYAAENDDDHWCQRIKYGQCALRKCNVEGGWTPGEPADYSRATCARYRLECAWNTTPEPTDPAGMSGLAETIPHPLARCIHCGQTHVEHDRVGNTYICAGTTGVRFQAAIRQRIGEK